MRLPKQYTISKEVVKVAKTMTRVWTQEQLSNLKDLEAHFAFGHVTLFPIIKEWGDSIYWDARVYKKGAAGVLPVTEESLRAIGVPESEIMPMLGRCEKAMAALSRLYPTAIPELVSRLKELEAAAPAALPSGS